MPHGRVRDRRASQATRTDRHAQGPAGERSGAVLAAKFVGRERPGTHVFRSSRPSARPRPLA
eukprot:scaffold49392_cov45-Phaeocystis_antarctica.AAC.1